MLVKHFLVMCSAFAGFCGAQDATPVVELSLMRPTHPYPQVASKISQKEYVRFTKENDDLKMLQAGYVTILNAAKAQIASAASRLKRGSFLQMNPVEPSFRVQIVPSAADTNAASLGIDSLEAKRQASEDALISGALSELSEFAKLVVQEFVNGLKQADNRRGTFLEAVPSSSTGFHRQLNIRVMSDADYPTVSNMVTQMQFRRDVSERAIRASILDMELQLAKQLNEFARTAVAAS